jgi:hypothetical protein
MRELLHCRRPFPVRVCWVWLSAAARNGRWEHFNEISGSWLVSSGITTARTSFGQDESPRRDLILAPARMDTAFDRVLQHQI